MRTSTIWQTVTTLGIVCASGGCDFETRALAPTDASAGGGLGGEPDARPDAGTGDDAGLGEDAATAACPPSYAFTIPSSPSRYRIIASIAPFGAHHADCRNDLAGATHLLAVDSALELAEIYGYARAITPQPPYGAFYVGAVQQPGELGLGDGWLIFTGAALDPALWSSTQPDDLDHWESFEEQRAAVDASGGLHDVAGGARYGAICECDGQPIAGAVTSALQF